MQVDTQKIEHAIGLILEAIGEDKGREGLVGTPARVARMYADLCTVDDTHIATFDNVEKYDQIVIVRKIPFFSLCEHHLIPFFGTIDIGYVPADRFIGLSKLARCVDLCSHRLQIQERLTTHIAEWIVEHLSPDGVGVICRARHLCMEMRGVKRIGAETITSAMLGCFRSDSDARREFLCLVQ